MARWQGKPGTPIRKLSLRLTLPRPGEERRAMVSGVLAGKLSKEEANYRPAMNEAQTKESCSECQNYETPGSMYSNCTRVAGIVEARDTCDLFVVRQQGSGASPQPQEVGVQVNG